MTDEAAIHLRERCRGHALRRAAQRGIDLGYEALLRLEQFLEHARPLYEQPGRSRYRLIVRRGGARLGVVYDVGLGCLVTVYRRPCWRRG
jgi:hypothetical protein